MKVTLVGMLTSGWMGAGGWHTGFCFEVEDTEVNPQEYRGKKLETPRGNAPLRKRIRVDGVIKQRPAVGRSFKKSFVITDFTEV